MSHPANKSLLNRIDGAMLWLYIALVAIGIIAVFSVEHRSTDPSIFMLSKSHMRQTIWLGISLFVGMIILFTDSKFFSSVAFLSYTICLILLLITIFAGIGTKGSNSWLGVGSIKFQPGEIGKIFTSLALARFLSLPETNFKRTKDRLIGLGIKRNRISLSVLLTHTRDVSRRLTQWNPHLHFCFRLSKHLHFIVEPFGYVHTHQRHHDWTCLTHAHNP